MDPVETLKKALEAETVDDRYLFLQDYWGWRHGDGYEPVFYLTPALGATPIGHIHGDDLARMLNETNRNIVQAYR